MEFGPPEHINVPTPQSENLMQEATRDSIRFQSEVVKMARDSIRFQSEVVKMARGYNSCCRLILFQNDF